MDEGFNFIKVLIVFGTRLGQIDHLNRMITLLVIALSGYQSIFFIFIFIENSFPYSTRQPFSVITLSGFHCST
jgi:hypothetical protein